MRNEIRDDRLARVEAHLERVIDEADELGLTVVRGTLDRGDDVWYGRLLVSVYGSMTDASESEVVVPAAAAVELLRGYYRLRGELLVQLDDQRAHSLTHDESTALLAGDYLYTSAYSSLGSITRSELGDYFEVFTRILTGVTNAFATGYGQSPDPDRVSFFDETAGAIGEGSAVLGAALADVTDTEREYAARVGRGLSTARQIHRALDADPGLVRVAPHAVDEPDLREHAARRRDGADRALDRLSETADVTPLRSLAAASRSSASHRRKDRSRE